MPLLKSSSSSASLAESICCVDYHQENHPGEPERFVFFVEIDGLKLYIVSREPGIHLDAGFNLLVDYKPDQRLLLWSGIFLGLQHESNGVEIIARRNYRAIMSCDSIKMIEKSSCANLYVGREWVNLEVNDRQLKAGGL